MWLILLLIALVILFYITGVRPFRYWDQRGVSTTKSWPYFGHLGQLVFRTRAMAYILDDIYKAFPEKRYVGYYHLGQPLLMIRDTELTKKIMIKGFNTFPDHRPFIAENTDLLWSNNLFAMRGGERWHKMRSTLSPAFTGSKMRMMFDLMKECSKQFSNYYSKQNKTVTIELKDAFTRFTNDVIATTAFGVTCDSLENKENEFYLMGKQITDFSKPECLAFVIHALVPTISAILKIPVYPKPIGSFFKNLIKETIQLREEKGIIRPDLIHLLMEARKGNAKEDNLKQKPTITDQEILAQALVFFLAGFDSVSTMMCFAAYELAVNPDIQEKSRKEVDEALKASNGNITYDILVGIKYLDMVFAGSRFALLEGKLILTEILSKFEIIPVEKTPIPLVLSSKEFNPLPESGFWLGLKPRF